MKELENDFIKYWIDDGILYSIYKRPTNITLEDAKAVIALRHEISNNEKQYWCYDFFNLKSFTKEATDYADIHGQEFLYVTAFIVHSHITTFIFNAFVKIKRPKTPIRSFKDKSKAIEWLKEIKKKNEISHKKNSK